MSRDKDPPNLPSGYNIIKKLGEGGYGSVYSCRHLETGKELAVKRLDDDDKKIGIPSLIEANIMSTLIHPNITSAIKITADNHDFLLFQDKARADLGYVVRKKNQLPSPQLLRHWSFAIVQAVACLHQQNIIHGDIKASNILIFDRKDESGHPLIRLSDFNLSRKVWPGMTSFSGHACTRNHRPLEVWLNQDWDMSIDIWSLGCTLYEIAYGDYLIPHQEYDRREDKEVVRPRFIACLEEFALNDPTGPQKIPWNYKREANVNPIHFRLSPNYYKPEYEEFNRLVMSMLRFDPKERPRISRLLQHPYFTGMTPTPYEKNTAEEVKLSSHKEASYMNQVKKLTNSPIIIDLTLSIVKKIQRLRFRYPNFEDDRLRLIGSYWIAHKIVTGKIPVLTYPLSVVHRIERRICEYLSYCLI